MTPAPSQHQGSAALFYRDSPAFVVESMRQFGESVIACQLAMEEGRWYIAGYYLAPGDCTMIQDVETAMAEKLRGTELIIAGDLKVDLEKSCGRGRE